MSCVVPVSLTRGMRLNAVGTTAKYGVPETGLKVTVPVIRIGSVGFVVKPADVAGGVTVEVVETLFLNAEGIGVGSHASPIPLPLESAWFGFGTVGQLSWASGMPSPSASIMVLATTILACFVSTRKHPPSPQLS